jgi:polysaccharide pyruvyl transferase WcaK-like protein
MTNAASPANARQSSQNKPLRVGLFGAFGSGNYGNDGSLAAMIGLLRRAQPDARLMCFCDGPQRIEHAFAIEAVAIRPLNRGRGSRILSGLLALLRTVPNMVRAIAYARKVDVLIVPGTGILDDFGCGPTGMPLDLFVWTLAARLTRRPFWFVSIGAGPIVHPLSRRLMVWAAKLASYRSYRDANSKLFLSEAGVDTRGDLVFPDLAFDLVPVTATGRRTQRPVTVAVGVMDYWGWSTPERGEAVHGSYQEKLSKFCVWLLEEGYHIRLLPGDDADLEAIRALEARIKLRLGDPALMHNVHADRVRNLSGVMSRMAEADIVVATRYHNVVCALKMGKPTLSLSYAEKNAALLNDAGLGSYVQGVENFDVENLKTEFRRLVRERTTLAPTIAAFLAVTEARLSHQEQLLYARLLECRKRPSPSNGRSPSAAVKRTAPVLGHDR